MGEEYDNKRYTKKQINKIYEDANDMLMSDVLKNVCHKSVSRLFTIHYFVPDTLISVKGDNNHKIYQWNEETTLYEELSYNKLAYIIQNSLEKYLTKKCEDYIEFLFKTKQKNAKKDGKAYKKLLGSVGDINFCINVVKVIVHEIEDNTFISKLDSDPNVVNFINGYVNLKHGKFATRKIGEHFFSKTLDYEYRKRDIDGELAKKNPDNTYVDENLIKFVEKMYLNICNDDWETTECVKEYLGYCMTGHVNRQVSLAFIGELGSNGKTIVIESYEKSQHIYVKKMDYKIFQMGYQKVHKDLSKMKGMRVGYVEEMPKKRINVSLYKDIVGGNHISNEVMYGTVEDIQVNFKLVLISNNTLKFDPDGGVERRGRLVECTNKFIDKDEYKVLEDKTGYHIKDQDLLDKFKKDRYKLALFHVLLPYAMKHYKKDNRLFLLDKKDGEKCDPYLSTKLHNSWKDVCGINDTMAEFLDLYYVKGDEDDIISKDDLLGEYRLFTGLNNLSFNSVLSDIKKNGYKYDSQRRCDGKRGIIIGLVRNTSRVKTSGKKEPTYSLPTSFDESSLEEH